MAYFRDEPHLLEAYKAGVDECISKPIGIPLLQAKVTSWLRRSWTVPAESLDSLQAGLLRLDPACRHISFGNGTAVKLTNLEFRLLNLLMSHPNQILPSSLIVDRVWGYSGNGDSILLKNLVYRLRRKLEENPSQPRYLQTANGEGYVFCLD